MKTTCPIICSLILGALPALAGSTVPSLEQPLAVAPQSSPWTCRMSLYGWVEELNGDAGVKGVTVPVDVDFNDILDNLDFAIMGAVEVGYGRWSLVADGIYADLSDSQTGRFGWRSDLDLEQFLGNFLVAYEVTRSESVKFDVYAGARVNSIETDLSFHAPWGGTFGTSGDKAWVDPVIGARLQAELQNHFFIRVLGDVGGFDVSSHITWQALAALGYHITERSSVLLGYRAIGTDYTDGGFTYDVVTGGVILGYQYAF